MDEPVEEGGAEGLGGGEGGGGGGGEGCGGGEGSGAEGGGAGGADGGIWWQHSGGGVGVEGADGGTWWPLEILSLLNSLSNASLSLLSSYNLCLASSTSFISLVAFKSVSVCFNFVLTIPNSIFVCSCWNDVGDIGMAGFFLDFLVFFSDKAGGEASELGCWGTKGGILRPGISS